MITQEAPFCARMSWTGFSMFGTALESNQSCSNGPPTSRTSGHGTCFPTQRMAAWASPDCHCHWRVSTSSAMECIIQHGRWRTEAQCCSDDESNTQISIHDPTCGCFAVAGLWVRKRRSCAWYYPIAILYIHRRQKARGYFRPHGDVRSSLPRRQIGVLHGRSCPSV